MIDRLGMPCSRRHGMRFNRVVVAGLFTRRLGTVTRTCELRGCAERQRSARRHSGHRYCLETDWATTMRKTLALDRRYCHLPCCRPRAVCELGLPDFLEDLVDLERLSHVEGVHTKMVSSYDQTGGNDDGFNPDWVEGNVYTIADLRGPGVVRRMWTARGGGQLKIYIDGNADPMVDVSTEDFFNGRARPFRDPLNARMGNGFRTYFPIPFAKSIKIQIVASENNKSHSPFGAYHHVTYHQFPSTTRVRSLALPLSRDDRQALDRVLGIWSNLGTDPKLISDPQLTFQRDFEIAFVRANGNRGPGRTCHDRSAVLRHSPAGTRTVAQRAGAHPMGQPGFSSR